MKTSILSWTIDYTYGIKSTIQEQPKYQRGDVWKLKKQQMLVDSILRGIDVPKVYLRKVRKGMFDFEVADGQQRLTAIFEFKNNEFPLSADTINGLDLSKIGRFDVGGKFYGQLNPTLQAKFDNYQLTIALVEEATNAEIRTLFGRLQMGDPLVPAEIRNAIISQLGLEIDLIALNHNFFENTRINSRRYKHQDYVTHVIALLHYNNAQSLKAPVLQELYFDLSKIVPADYISDSVEVLEHMYHIDQHTRKRIVNKWAFVDFFWFLYNHRKTLKTINYAGMGDEFDSFEGYRTANNRRPEDLIQVKNPSQYNKDLYNYIVSFNVDGGAPRNIERRHITFNSLFSKYLSF